MQVFSSVVAISLFALFFSGCDSSTGSEAPSSSSASAVNLASSSSIVIASSSLSTQAVISSVGTVSSSPLPVSSEQSSAIVSSTASSSVQSQPESSEPVSSASSVSSKSDIKSSFSSIARSSQAAVSSTQSSQHSSIAVSRNAVVHLETFAAREHGYSNLETTLLDSQNAHDAMLNAVQLQSAWNDKEAFVKALNDAAVDYDMFNVILFRHTESSGSNIVTPQDPQFSGTEATISIHRSIPDVGTDDMAYYLYAYRVEQTVTKVTFLVNGEEHVITMTPPNVCTEEYQPVCGALQVQCITTPCHPIPTTYSNLCYLQNEANAVYMYDGECEENSSKRSVVNADRIIQSNSVFGNQLMQRYLDPNENFFFSPFSIITALTMTYGGTYDKTAKSFENLFGYDENLSVHDSFSAMLQHAVPEHNTFRVANSIWPQKGYPFYPSYYSLIEQKYGADVFAMDYMTDATAHETINAWVEEKTEEKIKNLIPQPLSADTRMVLVNAIYFYGFWAIEFDKNDTQTAPFYKADLSSVDAEMMFLNTDVNYTSNEVFSAVDLGYAEREYSMIVMLPNARNTLNDVINYMTQHSLSSVVETMTPQTMQLYLPKFKIKWGTTDISQDLIEMGLDAPFGSEADFRLMADVQPGELSITKVLHQAFIEVSEVGTEAAAATAVIVEISAIPDPLIFRADRPFVFFIRDNRSGLVLFAGGVADPSTGTEETAPSDKESGGKSN